MTFQYNSFILQVAIHNTVTIQNKDTTEYKFSAHSQRWRHLHYVQYTERSGPFIVSPRIPPAVSAADKWAAGMQKGFQVLFITRGPQMAVVKRFYEWSILIHFANCALKHRYCRRALKHRYSCGVGGTG